MAIYQLYLESGPRRKKTLVHVIELLGCVAGGPTTEEALEQTPAAIRAFRRFLARFGASSDLDDEIELRIAEHVTEGVWLGNGDPSLVFEPDLAPLTPEDTEDYINRLEWMRADMQALVSGLSPEQLVLKPVAGRSIQAILEHVLESEYAYMRAFGKLEGLPGTGSIVKKRQGEVLDWLGIVRQKEFERLRSLSQKERSEPFVHWKYTRTARKVMRRMLEHNWEHLMELKARLGEPVSTARP